MRGYRQFRSVEDLFNLEGRGATGPKPRGWVIRFWESFTILGADDCWEWTAHRSNTNYGVLSIANAPYLAHRLAFLIANGTIEPDLQVMHSCDNPPCVNPAHLSQGTNAQNAHDAWLKGRLQKGERNGMAKFTEAQAIEIKQRRLSGERVCDLATEFHVWPAAITRIANGSRWKHLA